MISAPAVTRAPTLCLLILSIVGLQSLQQSLVQTSILANDPGVSVTIRQTSEPNESSLIPTGFPNYDFTID